MAFESQMLMKGLKTLDGNLLKIKSYLGHGGEGNVYLHEMRRNGAVIKVAVKSVPKKNRDWIR